MADEQEYLDYAGLSRYDEKLKLILNKKVDADGDKVLSEENFTKTDKDKLQGLENYTLPPTTADTLGGVKIEVEEAESYGATALKVDSTGKAYVDWKEAPTAKSYQAGLVKLGTGLKTGDDGTIEVDNDAIKPKTVDWTSIENKPDLVTRDEISKVYEYKGSVATYDVLPSDLNETNIGDVYNVEDTGMNYAFAGIGTANADERGWDALGMIFKITPISDEAIDALFDE